MSFKIDSPKYNLPLPLELRLKVLRELLVVDSDVPRIDLSRKKDTSQNAILIHLGILSGVSRELHEEVHQVFFGQNVWLLQLLTRDMMDTNGMGDHQDQIGSSETTNTLNGKMEELAVAEPVTEVQQTVENADEIDAEKLASEMQQRCRTLLAELEQFQAYLKQKRKEHGVELRTFKTGLQAEMKLIDKLASKDVSTRIVHSLRSSNFLFYATVWATAKTCVGIAALSRRFYWIPEKTTSNVNGNSTTPVTRRKSHSVVVDIVCRDGLEWVKVSSNTEKRIIWDLAKAGWVGDSSGEESEAEEDDDDEPQGLLKQAEALMKASRATRIRYQHPKVRLVLPRISNSPKAKEVAQVLQKIRNLGVTVQTSEEILAEPSLADVIERLTADRFDTFSDVLNIDCTVLLAFISDLSHGRVEPQDWHNKMISRQREMEAEEQLLPCSIWPACTSKKLVCTREAAVRMQEIVDIIGTPTEKTRADFLVDLFGNSQSTPQQRLDGFQNLSDYPIPQDWKLPIEIIEVDVAALKKDLPPAASILSDSLSTINASVFLYGWASGKTTVSSNRTVAKEFEATIEENRVEEETGGPDIWLCSTTRSLVGKEKQRRGAND
ncbi:hypothetical protein G7Y89_g1289 [Cudoniella acicularis]|uniref:DUF1308 domain-containing protein n=1 Tax=Cudoniella acicularis TaxID=354080 RepID=A0A8H4RXK9_9HELO|nr:hypothetical protein G7Y89_g1289 [Cudoniella acicularis]